MAEPVMTLPRYNVSVAPNRHLLGLQHSCCSESAVNTVRTCVNCSSQVLLNTVKEEIFVGEKFRTFRSKNFRVEFNFRFSN